MTLPPRPPQLNNQPGYNGGFYEAAPGTPKKPQPKKRFSWALVLTIVPVLVVIGAQGYKIYNRYQENLQYDISHEKANAVLTLDHDAQRTERAVKNALAINPNKDPMKVKPIQSKGNSVIISGTTDDYRITVRSDSISANKRDYMEYRSVPNQYQIHGYYKHFMQLTDQNCICGESAATLRGNQLSEVEAGQLALMDQRIVEIGTNIYNSLQKDPSYDITSIKYDTPETMTISVVVVSQDRWAIIGTLNSTEYKEFDFVRYDSWDDTIRAYGAYQSAIW